MNCLMEESLPTQIEIRGARVHNLKNIDLNIPLHKFIAISGLSGSGKSSLAMGIIYEEGSRRYLDALSTYMRRRIKQGAQATSPASSTSLRPWLCASAPAFPTNARPSAQLPRLSTSCA